MKRKTVLMVDSVAVLCAAALCGTAWATPRTLMLAKHDRVHMRDCSSSEVFSAYDAGNAQDCTRTRLPAHGPDEMYESGGAFTISGINGI